MRTGADPSLQDREGRTALHLAAHTGDEAVLRVVLSLLGERYVHLINSADFSGESYTCHCHLVFIEVVPKVACEILQHILIFFFHLSCFSGQYPVHLAVRKDGEHCLRLLVEAGAKINMPEQKSGCTALHLAVRDNLLKLACNLITEVKDLWRARGGTVQIFHSSVVTVLVSFSRH